MYVNLVEHVCVFFWYLRFQYHPQAETSHVGRKVAWLKWMISSWISSVPDADSFLFFQTYCRCRPDLLLWFFLMLSLCQTYSIYCQSSFECCQAVRINGTVWIHTVPVALFGKRIIAYYANILTYFHIKCQSSVQSAKCPSLHDSILLRIQGVYKVLKRSGIAFTSSGSPDSPSLRIQFFLVPATFFFGDGNWDIFGTFTPNGARKGDRLWKVSQTVSLSKNREIVNTKCGLHNEKSKS